MRLPKFATIRVTLLLICLGVVGLTSAHQHVYSRNWHQTLEVVVFPLNGDGQVKTDAYIQSLQTSDYSIIDRWAMREAKRHDLDLVTPFQVTLGAQIHKLPPRFPGNANPAEVIAWSLRFRYWAWKNTPDEGSLTRVRIFVVYHKGEDGKALAHSVGMQKGLMGLVHAFASHQQTPQNNIVIAHELLHTVGAIDKYDANGAPQYPIGYADSDRQPLYPQRSAEIMAGRIPTTAYNSYMAESLRSVILNDHTANEINWLE